MKFMLKKLWNYIESINGLLLILYSIFIFATAGFLNDHFSEFYFAGYMLRVILLSILICPPAMKFLKKAMSNVINDRFVKIQSINQSIISSVNRFKILFIYHPVFDFSDLLYCLLSRRIF